MHNYSAKSYLYHRGIDLSFDITRSLNLFQLLINPLATLLYLSSYKPRLIVDLLAVKRDMRSYVFLVAIKYYSIASFINLNLMRIFMNCFFLVLSEALSFIKICQLSLVLVF